MFLSKSAGKTLPDPYQFNCDLQFALLQWNHSSAHFQFPNTEFNGAPSPRLGAGPVPEGPAKDL